MANQATQSGETVLPVSARVMASVAGLTGVVLGIGSKAAIVMLAIWAIVATIITMSSRGFSARRNPFGATAFAAIVILSMYAAVSALWAINASAAFNAGVLLLITAVLAFLLVWSFEELPDAVVVLNAGWFVIGFVVGSLILLFEVLTDYALIRFFLNAMPFIRPARNSMIIVQNGLVTDIARPFGNWSVAGLNMMLWPVILMTHVMWPGRRGWVVIAAIVLLLLAATFSSEHQTSMLTIFASAVVFAISWRLKRLVSAAMIAGLAMASLASVPLAQLAHDKLELQRYGWLSQSLQGRIIVWATTAERVHEHPIVGIGAHNTAELRALTPKVDKAPGAVMAPTLSMHAHNNYLQIWLELGAVGALIVFAIGYFTISRIADLPERTAPYGYATASVGLLQSLATWNFWHSWYQAAFLLAFATFVLARRVAGLGQDGGPRIAFSDVWLPARLNAAVRRSSRRPIVGAVAAIVVATAAGWALIPSRVVEVSGDSFNLALRLTQRDATMLGGRELQLSASMMVDVDEKFALQVVTSNGVATSDWVRSGGWQPISLTARLAKEDVVTSIRFVHTRPTGRPGRVRIKDLSLTADGYAIDLAGRELLDAAIRSRLPPRWAFEGAMGSLRAPVVDRD